MGIGRVKMAKNIPASTIFCQLPKIRSLYLDVMFCDTLQLHFLHCLNYFAFSFAILLTIIALYRLDPAIGKATVQAQN